MVRNLARQKFVAQFLIALVKSRKVQFGEVAQHLNDAVKVASNETRIQDFCCKTDLNYMVLSQLLLRSLPAQGKLRLCLDRTEWTSASARSLCCSSPGARGLSGAALLGTAQQPQGQFQRLGPHHPAANLRSVAG